MPKLYNKIYAVVNHVGYAKHIGVNMKGRTYIYGNPYKMFSTEPWCVTLGDNVHITNEVVFVCHDGFLALSPEDIPSIPQRIRGSNAFSEKSVLFPGFLV